MSTDTTDVQVVKPYHKATDAVTLENRGWYERGNGNSIAGDCFKSIEIDQPCVLKTLGGHDAIRLEPGYSIRTVEVRAKVAGQWRTVGETVDVCSQSRVIKTIPIGQKFRIHPLRHQDSE